MSRYYIVFPSGDKTKLSIVEIFNSYEVDDYCIASRKNFDEISDVIEYAKALAKEYNLDLSSNIDEIKKELNYLD